MRIDVGTHEELKRLAAEFDTTVGNAVALAVREMRRGRIGRQLRNERHNGDTTWLAAELQDPVRAVNW